MEYLPGQFDQRGDSAIQCLSLTDASHKLNVRNGKLIIVEGHISQDDLNVKKNILLMK
ncbi:MAG: hypothetical protein ACRCR9_04665 [Chitinophagaceae bacterium]